MTFFALFIPLLFAISQVTLAETLGCPKLFDYHALVWKFVCTPQAQTGAGGDFRTFMSWFFRGMAASMIVMYIVVYIYLRVQSSGSNQASAQRLKAERSLLWQVENLFYKRSS